MMTNDPAETPRASGPVQAHQHAHAFAVILRKEFGVRFAFYDAGTGPAIGRYPDWSPEAALDFMDKSDIAVAILSLYVLAAFVGVGVLLGGLIVVEWPRVF